MSAEEYTIQGGREGKRRLEIVGRIFDGHTGRLLDELSLPEGISALDVGCGGGNVTLQIARRVGPTGRVRGIDFDVEVLQCAQLDARAAGIENVEFRPGDARAPVGGPYDLVTARFVLSHLAGPAAVLRALTGALRPGGLLVIEDTDFTGFFTAPPHPILARAVEVYRETLRRGGGDADIGQRLSDMLAEAGLDVVSLHVVQPKLEKDDRRLFPDTLRMMEPHVVGRGVVTAGELRDIVGELSLALEDPEIVGCPRVVQAAGRTPIAGPK